VGSKKIVGADDRTIKLLVARFGPRVCCNRAAQKNHAMTKEELRQILIAEQFKEHYYDLDGRGKDEALTLLFQGGEWCVFYSERGLQNDKVCYNSEDEACRRVLESLRCDPGAKKGYIAPVPFKPVDKS